MSKISRDKMRIAKLGKPGPWRGKKRPAETIEKFRLSHIGKRRSLQSRKNQSKTVIENNKIKFPNYIPSKQILSNRRRKERMKIVQGFHSDYEWQNLKAQYNWTCPACRVSEPRIKLTRDHIIPIANGGSNNIENIQPLCKPCNSRKHISTIKY